MANEKRKRADGVGGALSSALGVGAVAMASAALADLPAVDSTAHAAITLYAADPDGRVTAREVVYVTAHTAGDTNATVLRAQEGTSELAWSSGATWVHGPTKRDTAAGRLVATSKNGNTVLASSTSWSNFDTGIDLTLAAQAGDVIEANVSLRADNTTAVDVFLDVVTVVSGTPVTSFGLQAAAPTSTTGDGIPSLILTAGAKTNGSASVPLTLAVGDVDSGQVRLRMRYRTGTATGRTVEASGNRLLRFWAVNHGPQEA